MSEPDGGAGHSRQPVRSASKSRGKPKKPKKKPVKGQKNKGQKNKGQKNKGQKNKGQPKEGQPKGKGGFSGATGSTDSTTVTRAKRDQEVRGLLSRPDVGGPRVKLGVLWFAVAVASILAGRWSVLGVWGAAAAVAAWQMTKVWAQQPRASRLPSWGPMASSVTAVACTAAAGVGTALGGVALIVAPVVLVIVVAVSGRKPAAAGAAVIGAVLAAIPAMSVVLVARDEQWAALFLVVAVSFYDAGYFIGAAESSSRLEGPVTGAIGLLAVTFAASAVEVEPFDRVTAWMVGAVMALACPLGQMLVSAELPTTTSPAPAMRRLDAYLVSGPMMLAGIWALT